MLRRLLSTSAVAGLWFCSATHAVDTCYGPGDFDGNSTVDLDDFSRLKDCIGGVNAPPPSATCSASDGSAADSDGDADVDLHDIAVFLNLFQAAYFDYRPMREDAEAEQLAIELSGELRAPDYEYERIRSNLKLIRAEYSDLIGVIHHPHYKPGDLLVTLKQGVSRMGYDALNSFYQVTRDRVVFRDPEIHALTFCANLNPVPLAEEYGSLPEVTYAGPNASFCLDVCPPSITVMETQGAVRYTFSFAYLPDNCPGCWYCFRERIVDVTDFGSVIHVSCEDSCLPECP